mgnify:CR=1 FL=1
MYYLKIDSSFVGMESTRRYTSVNAREVSYRMNASSPVSAKDGALPIFYRVEHRKRRYLCRTVS